MAQSHAVKVSRCPRQVRTLWRWGLIGILVSPLIILIFKIGWPTWPSWNQLGPVLLGSLWQSMWSTFLSLIVGFLMALGLISVRGKIISHAWEIGLLLPVWLPSLFVILAILNVSTRFFKFPFGFVGVVFVHTFVMSGIVAVSLVKMLRFGLGQQIELAWIEGASRWLFLTQGLWPQLKNQIGLLALVIFSMCMTSFTIPLVVGGVRATSLEIFIYQQFHFGRDFHSAWGVVILEMLILMGLSLFLRQPLKKLKVDDRNLNLRFISWWPGLILACLPVLVLGVGMTWSWWIGYQQLQNWPEIQALLFPCSLWTLGIAFLTAVSVVVFMSALIMGLPHPLFRKWLLGYSTPSMALIGMALWSIGSGYGVWWASLKLVGGLTLVMTPFLYRWLMDAKLSNLTYQMEVAQTLGASWPLIWRKIVFPQLSLELGMVGGLAGLWASGDFTLSNMILSQSLTLAQLVNQLLSSYRLELATFLMWLLLGWGGLIYVLSVGVGYVASRKSILRLR